MVTCHTSSRCPENTCRMILEREGGREGEIGSRERGRKLRREKKEGERESDA